MSNVTDALAALKMQLIANLGLSPAPAVKIHHPAYDAATITAALANIDHAPVVVLFQRTHAEIVYDKQAFKHGGTKQWDIIALVYLEKSDSGPFPVLDDSAAVRAAIGRHDAWFDAMAAALEADRKLGGAVLTLGDSTALYRAMIGELPWKQDNYWGIEFQIPVREMR